MARPRGSRFRSQGQSRKVSWGEGPFGVLSLTATGASVFPTGSAAVVDDLTLVRTRGALTFITSVPTSANFMRYGFGICIVSANAAGIGAMAIPSAITDIDWDGWLYHRQGVAGADGGSGIGTIGAFQFDSKAMRKMHNTDVIVASLEVEETGAVTVFARLDSRQLFKLP